MDLKARLNEIHHRLLAGDRVASRDLFLAAGDPLRGFIAKKLPFLPDDDRHDVATDAIVNYLAHPAGCDTTLSSLWSYLCRIALADAIDLLRKSRRQRELLEKKVQTDVEFWAARAKDVFRGEDAIDARHIMSTFGYKLITNEVEARVLALLLTGEGATSAYAIALGLDPNGPDIKEAVKQAKDRMLQRLKRMRHEL